LRILHLPVEIGGHPAALAAEQRKLGHDAICLNLQRSELGFDGKLAFSAGTGGLGFLKRELARFRLLWTSLVWADIIHCHFGQTAFSVRPFPLQDPSAPRWSEKLKASYARALWLRDAGLWSLFGKKVFMTFYGDDVRLVSTSLARNPSTHLGSLELQRIFELRDPWKRRLVDRLARNGVTMFATNPDLLVDLPETASYLPYGHVNAAAFEARPPALEGPIRFVHLPTQREVKGTEAFIRAIEELQQAGLACSLTIVENVRNSDALQIIADHDVLLDQLRVGWYGGVAVEAMAMAKPVLCFLLEADVLLAPLPPGIDLPIIRIDTKNLVEVLRSLVAMDRDELIELGLRGRAFVENWHAPDRIARLVLDAYAQRRTST
jgi:hypothetical protein